MKAWAIFSFLFFASIASGQTPHLSWAASTSAGVTSYNVYRGPCTGTITANACSAAGSFAKINTAPISGVTYTDPTAAAGNSYDYYVTAVCASCTNAESAASPHFAVSIPTNLQITSVTRTSSGNRVTVNAAWSDSPGIKTTYTLSYAQTGALLTGGSATNSTGIYSMTWTGKVTPPSSSLVFKVCDLNGCLNQTF